MKENFLKFGRSGCKFYLEENRLIKISSAIEYNGRLYSQYLKQSKFESNNKFSTPSTYIFDTNRDLHSFSMDYIHGKTFENFCIDSNIHEIKVFSESLKLFIRENFKNSVLTEINFEVLKTKLNDLKNKLESSCHLYIDYLLNNIITRIPIGKNHGDLTMSNIIFSDRYYLIDFLDNSFETPINDLVKIKQDSEHNFYFDLINCYNTKVKICLDYINKEIDSEFYDIINSKEFVWFSIFNLIRILPYLKKDSEKKSVLKNLKKYECHFTSSR